MIILVVISLVIHYAFYLIIFSQLALYRENKKEDSNKKTSILICYKNEEAVIDKSLPLILQQKFDELILVDDFSDDGTLEKLKAHNSERVNILAIKETTAGKKKALINGIKSAKNDAILLTDADCMPASSNWSQHMCGQESTFVLGYGPMFKSKGLVGLFSRFETYLTALQYLSYALIGIPYMGVGRNMMIGRKIVLLNKGRIKGSKLASGDDDLMINLLANKDNTSICIHPESFMYSEPKTTLKAFLNQKTRHISTSVYYKPIHQVLLTLFSTSQIMFFAGLILGLILGTIAFKIALLMLLTKWFVQQAINFPVMKKLKEEDLFWKFPVLDVLFFVYLLVMPFYYFINKNNSRWS